MAVAPVGATTGPMPMTSPMPRTPPVPDTAPVSMTTPMAPLCRIFGMLDITRAIRAKFGCCRRGKRQQHCDASDGHRGEELGHYANSCS